VGVFSLRQKNIPVVWRFFAAYIAIVLVVLLLVSPIYQMVPAITRDNLLQRYQQQLEVSGKQLENQVSGTMSITDTLGSMQEFSMLKINTQGSSAHTRYLYYLGKVRTAFASQLNMLGTFDNAFLLFTRSGMCMMSHISYTSFEDCLDDQLGYPEEIRQEILRAINDRSSTAFYVLPSVPAGRLTLSHKSYMTLLVRDMAAGTVLGLLMSDNKIKESFQFANLPEGSFLQLVDSNGRTLFQCGEAAQGEVSTLSADLTSLGCRVMVSIPSVYFDNMVRPISQTTVYYVLLALGAGLFVSAFMSSRSARPIRSIASRFAHQGKVGNEYQQILAGIEASSQTLDRLQVALEKNSAHMRTNLFARLAYGVTLSDTDRDEAVRLLPQLAELYQIALLKLDLTFNGEDKPNADYISLLAYEYLKSTLGTEQIWTQLDKERIAMLLPGQEEHPDYAAKLLEGFSAYMDRYGVCVMCGISDIFTGADNVDRAYRQARFRQRIVLEREQDVASESTEQFDVHSLAQVYEAMCAGDREALAGVMDSIIQMVGNQTPEDAMEQYVALRCALRCAQRDLAEDLQVATPPTFSLHMSTEACYRALAAYADEVLEHISTFRSQDDAAFVSRVCTFIDENYDDPELGADSIARAFGISRSQLYSLFQQNCARSIGEIIRQVRMEHAHDLLTNSEMNVSDIAMSCGYSSVNTFCRAFKKHFSIPPNALRSNHG